MIRIASGSRVVYADRRWKLSFACFLVALLIVGFPMTLSVPEQRDSVPPVAIYGGAFVLAALLLLSSRTLVIDGPRGSLLMVERRPLSFTRRKEYSLRDVRVRTSSAEEGPGFFPSSRTFYIWIEVSGGRRIPFMGRLSRQEQVHDLVVQLNRDLQAAAAPAPLE